MNITATYVVSNLYFAELCYFFFHKQNKLSQYKQQQNLHSLICMRLNSTGKKNSQ